MLGPDAGVEHADDYVLAGPSRTTRGVLAPESTRRVQAEEGRGVVGLDEGQPVLLDREHSLHLLEGRCLRRSQRGREAVDRIDIVVELPCADLAGDLGMLGLEVIDVPPD